MMWRRVVPGCLVALVCLVVPAFSHTIYEYSRMRFNYDPDPRNPLGVFNWPRTFSENCGGIHQSPVDIDTARVRYGTRCSCPTMHYESPCLRGEMKNNGHTATFEPENKMDFMISGVPYRPGVYVLNDFHLHYGGVSGRSFELQGLRFRGAGIMSAGSEHTIDGLRFEGELHFVFYNSKYPGLEQAEDKEDGLVVMVVLVQQIPGTMADTGESSRFSDFLQRNIPNIFPYQSNYSTVVDMGMFFQRECEFYTYTGSTTTPACRESVRWIILREPIRVTERAWFVLTGLQSRGEFNSQFGNYRTTQPVNDRIIEANFDRSRGARLPSPTGQAQTRAPEMARVQAMSNMADVPARSRLSQSPAMLGMGDRPMTSVNAQAMPPAVPGSMVGMMQSGMAGMMMSGAPMPGMVMPGTPMPGMVVPGTPALGMMTGMIAPMRAGVMAAQRMLQMPIGMAPMPVSMGMMRFKRASTALRKSRKAYKLDRKV